MVRGGRSNSTPRKREVAAARETTGTGAGTAAPGERETEATTGTSSAGEQTTSRPVFSGHAETESGNAGTQSGSAYGQRHSKAIPPNVDEVIAVPPPAQCGCGGPLKVERIEPQYQQEIGNFTQNPCP